MTVTEEGEPRDVADDVQDITTSAGVFVEEARSRFISDLQALAGHARELLQVTTTISTESVAAAREKLGQSLDVAAESIKKFQAETLDRGRKVAQQTDSYVRENPWQAIAIGMVAGLALGLAGGSVASRARS
jgi:ElaB/YqjD/DUF883 family membrane-anchored ribosome-binding protein